MADPRGLNDDLNIIANTPIPGLDDDLDIISKLDDEPNDVGGLSAAELKARFDQAGLTIQDYINEKLIPAVLGTAAQEAVREANEDQRKANETQRQSQEAARQAQESARQSAESARAAAETGRSGAESGRVTAEAGRAGAETARAAAETARESTENQREAAETARVNAETARVNAESGRVSAESGRSAAEEQRVGAENARAAAETARQDNETARTAAETGRVYAERAREAEQAAFFEGVMAQAATLAAGAQATAEAQPVGESFMVKFGIPRGNKGDKGDKGDTGAGLEVLGIYGTLAALEAAHPAGSAGEAYAVGTAENNAVYVWSGDAWASIGPLRGPQGPAGDSIVPDPEETQSVPRIFGIPSSYKNPDWFPLEEMIPSENPIMLLGANNLGFFPTYMFSGFLPPIYGKKGQIFTKTEYGASWEDPPDVTQKWSTASFLIGEFMGKNRYRKCFSFSFNRSIPANMGIGEGVEIGHILSTSGSFKNVTIDPNTALIFGNAQGVAIPCDRYGIRYGLSVDSEHIEVSISNLTTEEKNLNTSIFVVLEYCEEEN